MQVLSIGPSNRAPIPEDVLRLDYVSSYDGCRDWALVRPAGSRELWVVVVHGHGSHGDQLYTRDDVRRARLPQYERRQLSILNPNLRDNAWMSPAAAHDLHALLEFVRAEWHARRFLFFSGSMGGTSNLIYAALHPAEVAAVIALGAVSDMAAYHQWCRERNEGVVREIADAIETSYRGTPAEQPGVYHEHSAIHHAERLGMPIFLAHGECDAIMPVTQSRSFAERLANAANFRYDEVSGGGHDAALWNTDALDWVMERI